jgi:HK97 family phage portal protein
MPIFQKKNLTVANRNTDYNQTVKKVYESLSAFFGYSISNIPDNLDEYIKHGYMYNADVYTIVNLIVKKISGVSWVVNKVVNEKSLRQYKTQGRNLNVKRLVLRAKALEEINEGNVYELLHQPNSKENIDTFASNSAGNLALTGNLYWYTFKPENGVNAGKTTQIMNLPPQITQIVTGNAVMPVAGYKVLYNQTVKYDASEVIHKKFYNPQFDSEPSAHLYGMSPLKSASRLIYTSNESIEANVKLLKHLGAIGMLSPDYSGNNANVQFGPTQADQLQKKMDEKYNNPQYYGKKVVTAMPMKWQSFGMNAEELAIIDLQKFTFTKLCNVYGLDPNLFGTDTMRDNNKQQAARDAWTNCLMYYLDVIREALNEAIAKPWSDDQNKYFIDYDISTVEELQSDMDKITDQALKSYWLTINEKRSLTSWDTLDDGDVFAIPAGLMLKGNLSPDHQFDMSLLSGIGEYGVKYL